MHIFTSQFISLTVYKWVSKYTSIICRMTYSNGRLGTDATRVASQGRLFASNNGTIETLIGLEHPASFHNGMSE